MKSILFREIQSFFGSLIGYLVIGVFLLLNGLFLWVFQGDFNILDNSFADLTPFFTLAPWVLIFLIPAVTMRSFSDERKQGTLEILLTKPLSVWQIVNGKFLGALLLIIIALLPTLIYVYVIYGLTSAPTVIDSGSIIGSYFGLLFLVAGYTSVGIFTSILTENQIVAFILAVFLCFLLYFGMEGLASQFSPYNDFVASLGMDYHFRSISRGVLDTRDIIYFLSVTILFLSLTVFKLKSLKKLMKTQKKNNIKQLVYVFAGILAINFLGGYIYKRFDMTHDKRYTLSETTKDVLKEVNTPLEFTILLQGDDFPSEFKRLQQETRQLLEEFRGINSNIRFVFENPLEGEQDVNQAMYELDQLGFSPTNIPIKKQGNESIVKIFPWAIGYDGAEQKSVRIPLLVNNLGISASENIQKSVEQLEYAFADAIYKLTIKEKKTIAILKGNGELDDKYLSDFVNNLKPYYQFGEFDIKNFQDDNQKTIQNLDRFDLAIVAKPTQAFSEREKYILDQYIMKGKPTMWLMDQVRIDLDSLNNRDQSNVAMGKDLNLDEMFFRYGFRLNYNLIQDYLSIPITLKDETGQDLPLDWWYSIMVPSKENHLINKNINVMKMEFANSIDTLVNGIKKTVLLQTSEMSRTAGVPQLVSLFQFDEQEPFVGKPSITGVLLEGNFVSTYKNKVKPFNYPNQKDDGENGKMIVISDGDFMNYMYSNKRFLANGYDNWTKQVYGNKDFLINSVHYLLDESGVINIRAKEVQLAFFDKEKVKAKYTRSQIITVGLPIVLLAVFGIGFNYLRKRRYTNKFS